MAGPEWPPSPWRLLRGLAAAWFDANPHPFSEAERDDLLQALGAASPPALWLPPVSFAEIPYYQPIRTSTPQDRVLHFDHFAVLSEGDEGACFCFDFDVVLSARQQSILAQLLARMTYLGRAESRARLSLVDTPSEHLSRVTPTGRSSSVDIRRRVLVTRGTFRASDLWAAESGGGHLVQAMLDEGRKQPPNTNWIDYELPPALVRRQLPRRPAAGPAKRPRVAAVQFGLFRRIPIRLPELVRVARAIRDHAATSFEVQTGEPSRRLAGRAADGSIATGHLHAFWLPEPDRTGCLQRLTVWLPDGEGGIEQCELDALLGVQHILRDDAYPILVVAERVAEIRAEPTPSRRWRSVTPFLAPLHSRRGRSELTPSEQLQRLASDTVGANARVTSTSGTGSLGRLTAVRAHLYRRGTWRLTRRVASWFELKFDDPVVLPRPLGADAHFGLGRFVPIIVENEN